LKQEPKTEAKKSWNNSPKIEARN